MLLKWKRTLAKCHGGKLEEEILEAKTKIKTEDADEYNSSSTALSLPGKIEKASFPGKTEDPSENEEFLHQVPNHSLPSALAPLHCYGHGFPRPYPYHPAAGSVFP